MHATLTDFGLMKDLGAKSQITQAGSVIGTFDYAAPEQLKEGPIDARTDVYALGGVLFQAITGKVPYQRETAAATMLAHLDSPPPSLLSVLPDASERLGEVVRRAMAKDPEERHPSAGDLGRAALAAVQDRSADAEERSVATGDASPTLPARRPSRSHPGSRSRPARGCSSAAPSTSSSSRPATPPPRPASASSSCSSASPGSARRGWRPSWPGACTTRA